MKYIISLCCLFVCIGSMAQTAAEQAIVRDGKTLNQRYSLMKEKSETFNEYKVIREYILDGMWKLTNDSIKEIRAQLAAAHDETFKLQQELNASIAAIKQKEESMTDVAYASTHITVLGIDFTKKFFVGMIGIVFLGMLLLLGLATGRLKMMYQSLKEKIDAENMVSTEYENYKRKALEKQMKLSRELQNERNKMAEMRSA